MDYDRYMPDAYSKRLGSLSKQNKVTATHNICNADGAILIAKGSEVSSDIVNKIQRHRLSTPLEEQIALENSLTAEELFGHFQDFLFNNPEYTLITRQQNLEDELLSMCRMYSNHPLLVQKMTVFCATVRRSYFERALFCAWLSLILGKGLRYSTADKKSLFLAALFQDVGLLHLEDHIVDGGLVQPESRMAFMAHPIISATFLKAVPHVTETSVNVVIEHHENAEGTGYPKRSRHRLEPLSEVLQFANVMFEMQEERYREYFSFKNIQPVIKLSSALYKTGLYSVMYKVIDAAGLPVRSYYRDTSDYRQFVSGILMNHSFLANWFQDVIKVQEVMSLRALASDMPSVVALYKVVWRTVSSTGILSEGLVRWVSHVEEMCLEDAAQEILEIHILQQELASQLTLFMGELESVLASRHAIFNKQNLQAVQALLSNMKRYESHINPQDLDDSFNLDDLFG